MIQMLTIRCHEINSHKINSHEINSREINSHKINFSRDQFPYDQLNFFYLIITIYTNELATVTKKSIVQYGVWCPLTHVLSKYSIRLLTCGICGASCCTASQAGRTNDGGQKAIAAIFCTNIFKVGSFNLYASATPRDWTLHQIACINW